MKIAQMILASIWKSTQDLASVLSADRKHRTQGTDPALFNFITNYVKTVTNPIKLKLSLENFSKNLWSTSDTGILSLVIKIIC